MDADAIAGICVCCAEGAGQPHLPGLLRCGGCGHVWADMALSDAEIAALYSSNYFFGEEYLDYAREKPALKRNFEARVRDLSYRHGQGATLWEIGCAFGYFLEEASKYFDVAGCDISADAVAHAHDTLSLDAVAGEYLALPPKKAYDIICLWDTIEHLREPQRYIEKASQELVKGGTIAITTGDIGAWLARVRGAKWRMIHPPSHLHYFTAGSITTLLDRMGFKDIQVRHRAQWRSADLCAYLVLKGARPGPGASVYKALRASGLLNFHFPVNTFDIMTVYGRCKS